MRFVDHHQSMLERQGNDEEDESALYFEAGPFQDAAPCYLLAINRAKERKQPLHKGVQNLLRMLFSWVPATRPEVRAYGFRS